MLIDQAGMTKASKAKEKTKTQNKHDVTDDGGDSIAGTDTCMWCNFTWHC